MDPIEQCNQATDTTVGILDAARRMGWSTTYFTAGDVSLCDGEVRGLGREVRVDVGAKNWFALEEAKEMAPADLDAILIRTEPPVDETYMTLCQILEFVPGKKVFNSPSGILRANEKIFAQRFAKFQPATLISSDHKRIRDFIEQHKDVVIKPTNGLQGRSIFHLRAGDLNVDTMIEELTTKGTRFCVTQELVPEYAQGDLRVLLINGEPVPYGVLRVPPEGKLRANLAAGGMPRVVDLDKRAMEICQAIAPELKAMGLFFVGIDIIGGRLTEINVTCPTGMREIDAEKGLDIGTLLLNALKNQIC